MKVIIRADASVKIGSGHIMRCLTVANQLSKRGYEVLFLMRELDGSLESLVRQDGHAVKMIQYSGDFCCEKDLNIVRHLIEKDQYDLCIIDHYNIDSAWELGIREFVSNIVVIDDLANRTHHCNLLIDQNFVANYQNRYTGLVPDTCTLLLGPQYLILRDEFLDLRKNVNVRNGVVNHLLIFMGGSDPTGETLKVLNAIQHGDFSFQHLDVVVGHGNPEKELIEQECLRNGHHYHCQINYLATLISKADFAIGAGGSTTWERCYLGLPSSATIIAENQMESTKMASQYELVWNLGWHEEVTSETYNSMLNSLSNSTARLVAMSESGLRLTTNPDGPNRWIKRILEIG